MSNRADTKMVQALKVKNTQAKYNCGNKVIIRRFSSRSRRKSAKEKQKRFVVGEIIQHSSKNGNYKVKYVLDDQEHKEWFKVTDLTSLTLEEEKCRHQLSAGVDSIRHYNIVATS